MASYKQFRNLFWGHPKSAWFF